MTFECSKSAPSAMQQQVSETLRRMGAVGCLELLGHALVTVPYWDWDGCKGPGEREQYCVPEGQAACVQRPCTKTG